MNTEELTIIVTITKPVSFRLIVVNTASSQNRSQISQVCQFGSQVISKSYYFSLVDSNNNALYFAIPSNRYKRYL